MTDVVIDNPILNPPFHEPTRHFRFGDKGITADVVEARRVSSYFMPIPAARKKSQMQFDTEWTRDRMVASLSRCNFPGPGSRGGQSMRRSPPL